jgi:hypothetical protein
VASTAPSALASHAAGLRPVRSVPVLLYGMRGAPRAQPQRHYMRSAPGLHAQTRTFRCQQVEGLSAASDESSIAAASLRCRACAA